MTPMGRHKATCRHHKSSEQICFSTPAATSQGTRVLIVRLTQREGKVNQAQRFVTAPIHTVEVPSPFSSFLPEKKKASLHLSSSHLKDIPNPLPAKKNKFGEAGLRLLLQPISSSVSLAHPAPGKVLPDANSRRKLSRRD